MRSHGLASSLGIVFALSICEGAHAQEINITGPLTNACPLIAEHYFVPAPIETTSWVSGGAVTEIGHPTSGAVAFGGELTTGVYEFREPAVPGEAVADRQRRRSPFEIRIGPWAELVVRQPGALAEGGMTTHVGATKDSIRRLGSIAMFDLRLGGGYGSFEVDDSPHVAVALAWGLRTVFERDTRGGACDPEPEPPLVADATAVRLVATVRQATKYPATEVGVALEVTPNAIFLPWRIRETRERPSR